MKKWFGLLLIILLLSLLISCSGVNGITPSNEAEKFVGFWVNEDKVTPDITKIDIARAGNDILVHMWGKCTPDDCDWGITKTAVSDAEDGILNLTWDHGFSVITQELFLLSDVRLKVNSFYYFREERPKDYGTTEYFVKKS